MNQTTALARLRAADPANNFTVDSQPEDMPDPVLLAEITAGPGPVRRSWLSRHRRPAAAITAGTAAVVALFVSAPWSAAYAVDRQADGSVAVSFDAARLGDPGKLNRDLARAGARTVVMGMVSQEECPTPPLTPGTRLPVDYRPRADGVSIVVKPWEIPAGETLVFGYAITRTHDGSQTMVRPMLVRVLPSCIGKPVPPRAD